MADKEYKVKIQMKTDTYENWYVNHGTDIPLKGEVCVVLYQGEQAYNEWENTVGPRLTSSEEDMPKYRVKIGDGTSTFKELDYIDQRIAEILFKLDTDLDTVANLAGGAVQKTFKINGQALTGDEITIETSAGVSSVNSMTGDVTITAASISAVPTSRAINSHPLTANVVLTADDVNALSADTQYVSSINGKSGSVTLSAGNKTVLSST